MADPRNKVFIITGSARGLGKGFAEAVLKEGAAAVTISDVLDDVGQKTVTELSEKFGKERLFYCHCDVTKQEEFENLWDETEKHFGKSVDVLVNNAGINHKFGWKKCMDIDIYGVMIGTYMAFDRMGQKGSGRGGHVINIASLAGIAPAFNYESSSYFVAKAGVVQLTKSLGTKVILAQDNVRVSCLCPSFANTNIINIHDDIMEGLKKKGIQGENLMTVEKVVDAFMQLFKDNRNGAALAVMPRVPPFYWPDLHNTQTVYFLAAGSGLLSKVFGYKTMKPHHQLLFVLLILLLLYLLLKMFIFLFF